MMAIKEICKACLNAEVQNTYWNGGAWEYFLWDESNERCWENGELCCPAKDWGMIKRSAVPKVCLRKFEYTILGQKGANKLGKP